MSFRCLHGAAQCAKCGDGSHPRPGSVWRYHATDPVTFCTFAPPVELEPSIEETRRRRRDQLVAYLRSCVDAGDWHGVRDAAVDIEVIEGQMR